MRLLVCLSLVEKAEQNILSIVPVQSEQEDSVEDRTNLDQPQPASFCCL